MALRNLDSTKPIINNKKYGFDTINKGFFKRNDEKKNDEQYRLGPVRGLMLTILLMFYWEVLLGSVCDGIAMNKLLFYFLSSSVIASAVGIVSCVFRNRVVNYITSFIAKVAICFVYVGQALYYDVHNMFSDKMFAILQMDSSDIIKALASKWWFLILMILPFVISIVFFVIYNRIDVDVLGYTKRTIAGYIFVVLIGVLAFSSFKLSVQLIDTDSNPVYSVYLESGNHNEYIDNFGMSSYVVRGTFAK